MTRWAVGEDQVLVPEFRELMGIGEADASPAAGGDRARPSSAFQSTVGVLVDRWREAFGARLAAAWFIDRRGVEPEGVLLTAFGADGVTLRDRSAHATSLPTGGLSAVEGITFERGTGGQPSALCVGFVLNPSEELRLWFELPAGVEVDEAALARIGRAREALAPVVEQAHEMERLALENQRLAARVRDLETRPESGTGEHSAVLTEPSTHLEGMVEFHGLESANPAMHRLFATVERIKNADLNVLLLGETGTGKELFARAIHRAGLRADAPFEVVGCGSISNTLLESELFGHRRGAFSGAERDHAGIFERANGGTVFLDEIADMSPEMQQKILRVLQESEVRPVGASEPISVDVRVIAASKVDLNEAVARNEFREDLYYRLNVFALDIPPLRERPEDIPLLAERLIAKLSEEHGTRRRLAENALTALTHHAWPGNVQELKNLLTRAYLEASTRSITKRTIVELLATTSSQRFTADALHQDGEYLHLRIPVQQGFNEIISECERLVIISSLQANRGNKSRVTKQLGIPRQTLYNKITKLEITEADYLTD